MYIFQVVCFVFEIVFGLLLGGFVAVCPDIFDNSKTNKSINYVSSYKLKDGEKNKRKIWNLLGRSIWFIVVMGVTIYFLKPYFLDFPKLIKGDFYYVTGYVDNVKTEKKDFQQYIYIEGKKLKFFFSSGVEVGKRYKIGYLPNTSRAIYGKLLDNNQLSNGTTIKFPYKDIALFIGILGAIVLLIGLSSYLRFKLLIIASVVFYPINILLYVKEGLKLGLWFSFRNTGLLFLTFGAGITIFVLLIYLVERKRDWETPQTLIATQFMSVAKIFSLIETFQILLKK